MSRKIIPFIVIIAIILAACSGTESSGGLSGSGLDPSPQLSLEQADQVAETFLQAWVNADYATMYDLISPNSRDAYSLEAFSNEYEYAAEQMTLNTLSVEVTQSLRQGTTAQINYNVSFDTGVFGQIMDNDRTMRLIETPEGWRVAWSRMDIFAEMAEGAQLELRRTQPSRGNIYDRNGQVLADQNGRSVVMYAVKQDMPNVDDCITALSRIMHKEKEELATQFDQYLPETLFRVGEIDPDTFQREEQVLRQVCDIGDDPIDTSIRPTRRYFGNVAPHIVGYVGQIRPEQVDQYETEGYPPNALVGQEGIEQTFESYLAGKMGGELVIIAPTGQTLRTLAESPAEPGQSVYLTIDRDLQAAVLDAFVEAYNNATPTWSPTSPGAAAVVMDVKTGEVLAAVSYPSYSPGVFNPDTTVSNPGQMIADLKSDWRTPLFNRVTRGLFPAASVFKIISMAAGLDSGVYTTDTWYTCNGIWYGGQYGDAIESRRDWVYPGSHGPLKFIGALTQSCDPYFWELGVALHNADPNLLPEYAYKMGLGVPTGNTDLPEEVGYIPNPQDYPQRVGHDWAIGDTLNLVIGQGQMQITPLQIARMTAAVANGGTLHKPLFVKEVKLIGEDPVYTGDPTPVSTLDFAPEVFEAIQTAMCDVTLTPGGTARFIFEPWYEYQGTEVIVCGKTGTAQTGGATTPPQAWFVAYAPREDPQIAVAVIVENSCEGSEVAAPIVRRIIEDYFGMPHSTWPELWETGCATLGE